MMQGANMANAEKGVNQMEAIINSMTPHERHNPDVISGSRKKRIAAGSGTQMQDVNRLLKQHKQMAKMMKKLKGKGGMAKMMRGMKGMLPAGYGRSGWPRWYGRHGWPWWLPPLIYPAC